MVRWRRFVACTLVAVGLLAFAGALQAARVTPCAGGRFLLAAGSVVLGGAAGSVDAVVLASDGMATLGACGTTRAVIRGKARFTTVQAQWAACGTLAKVRLKARIAAPACTELSGTLRAKRVRAEALRASRSVCGDGTVDASAGEECEPGTAGGDDACPGACGAVGSASECRCEALPTTTSSTSTSTSTSSTTSTSSSTSTSTSTSTSSSSSTSTSTSVTTTSVTTTSSTAPCLDVDGDGCDHLRRRLLRLDRSTARDPSS